MPCHSRLKLGLGPKCVADGKKDANEVTEINYRAIYASALQPYIFIAKTQQLAAYMGHSTVAHLSIDHVVELETVVAYLTSDWTSIGLSENQVAFLIGFINSQGNTGGLTVSP